MIILTICILLLGTICSINNKINEINKSVIVLKNKNKNKNNNYRERQ